MAMHLSLQPGGGDVRPEYNNIPQFMFFNNLRDAAGVLEAVLVVPVRRSWRRWRCPTLAAAVFGFFILRNRVRGVYFSIITQALAQAAWLLISRNEMLLGGTNGLTNFNKALTQSRALDHRPLPAHADHARPGLPVLPGPGEVPARARAGRGARQGDPALLRRLQAVRCSRSSPSRSARCWRASAGCSTRRRPASSRRRTWTWRRRSSWWSASPWAAAASCGARSSARCC